MTIFDFKAVSYDVDTCIELIDNNMNTIGTYSGFITIPDFDGNIIYIGVFKDKMVIQLDIDAINDLFNVYDYLGNITYFQNYDDALDYVTRYKKLYHSYDLKIKKGGIEL